MPMSSLLHHDLTLFTHLLEMSYIIYTNNSGSSAQFKVPFYCEGCVKYLSSTRSLTVWLLRHSIWRQCKRKDWLVFSCVAPVCADEATCLPDERHHLSHAMPASFNEPVFVVKGPSLSMKGGHFQMNINTTPRSQQTQCVHIVVWCSKQWISLALWQTAGRGWCVTCWDN